MTQTIAEILVNWGPILLFLGFFIYFMRKTGVFSYRQYMESTSDTLKEQLSQLKELNQKLDRIAALLEKSAGPK